MSVYTHVSPEELSCFLSEYHLGKLVHHEGIHSGIENTNYFLTTSTGSYVLTLFEQLSVNKVQGYLALMEHLADAELPVARPERTHDKKLLSTLKHKPCSIVARLPGRSIEGPPSMEQCRQLGIMMARLHIHSPSHCDMDNERGLVWLQKTTSALMSLLEPEQTQLLQRSLHEQNEQLQHMQALPSGIIHADLFRDNALFQEQRLSGVIDFYYATRGSFLYDLAVSANDWCFIPHTQHDATQHSATLLEGYQSIRPLSREEKQLWPVVLRGAALRFWLSRLHDSHFPREGLMTHSKDPQTMQALLSKHQNTRPLATQ